MVFGLFKKEKPDLEKDLNEDFYTSDIHINHSSMSLFFSLVGFESKKYKAPLKKINNATFKMIDRLPSSRATYDGMVEKYGGEIVDNKILQVLNDEIIERNKKEENDTKKYLRNFEKDKENALKKLNLWMIEKKEETQSKSEEKVVLENFNYFSNKIVKSGFQDWKDYSPHKDKERNRIPYRSPWLDHNPNEFIKNFKSSVNDDLRKLKKKEKVISFLKKEGTKLPASDIDFQLKIGNVDLVKKFCEEMYRDKEIGRTGNYRYFV